AAGGFRLINGPDNAYHFRLAGLLHGLTNLSLLGSRRGGPRQRCFCLRYISRVPAEPALTLGRVCHLHGTAIGPCSDQRFGSEVLFFRQRLMSFAVRRSIEMGQIAVIEQLMDRGETDVKPLAMVCIGARADADDAPLRGEKSASRAAL